MNRSWRQLLLFSFLAIAVTGVAYVFYQAAFGLTRTKTFVDDLTSIRFALESFKSKCGVYPPSHNDALALESFQANAFARPTDLECLQATLIGDPQHPKSIDEAEALVLYLGFLSRDPENPYWFAIQMAGDSPDSSNPTWKQLLEHGDKDLMPFYEFQDACLVDRDGDGFPEFTQRQVKGKPVLELNSVPPSKARSKVETGQ